MIKGGLPSTMLSTPHGLSINASAYGKAVKYAAGLVQISPDLIWYNNWKASGSPPKSAQGLIQVLGQANGGKKGGKKSGKKSDTSYYSAAIDMVLGLAPVAGVLSIWYNNQKFTVTQVSASGVVVTDPEGSGNGVFTFVPNGHDSSTAQTGTVPGSPYQVQVPNFVADQNTVQVNGVGLYPADPSYPPGAGQYTFTNSGLYTFNPAQSGGAYKINYRALAAGGSPGMLAGILAVTVLETYSQTFNDFGAPGAVTEYGSWEVPCWNAACPVPGRIDSGAFRARDPYSWWWDGSSPTVYVPRALIGSSIAVYYGVPQILNSDGTFYSGTITPLALLNMEFEPACGEGAEYSGYPAQQVVNSFSAGVGSVQFYFGAANTMPGLNLESIAAFSLWPNGDADVADILTDIVMSGPVLV